MTEAIMSKTNDRYQDEFEDPRYPRDTWSEGCFMAINYGEDVMIDLIDRKNSRKQAQNVQMKKK